jgi:hypothetical protein
MTPPYKNLTYNIDVTKKVGGDIEKRGKESTEINTQSSSTIQLEQPQGAPVIEKEREEQQRTRIKKNLFIEVFIKTLGSVKPTCDKVGIERTTYYLWLRTDPEFNLAIRNTWTQKLEDIEAIANQLILEKDPSMTRHFLDRRHPLYKPKVKVEGPVAGETAAENDMKDFFNLEENANEPGLHTSEVSDQEQARDISTIPSDASSEVLLGPQNTPQPDIESPAERP